MKATNRIVTGAIIATTILLIWGGVRPCLNQTKSEQRNLVIRFDDYGIWCSADWITIEERLLDIHKKHNLPITWSVVPQSIYPHVYHPKSLRIYPDDQSAREHNLYPLEAGTRRVDTLKVSIRDGVSYLAVHGYYHPKFYSNIKNSEFYGVDYDTQFFKLKQGKAKLDSLFDTDVKIFVPPHNSYDYLTLDAMSELGYSIISAKDPSSRSPEDNSIPIKHLNFTTDNVSSLLARYKTFSQESSNGIVDVLLLHHTNFTNSIGILDNAKLENYDSFLGYLKQNKINVTTFEDVCEKEEQYQQNNSLRRKVHYTLTKISPIYAAKVLHSSISAEGIVRGLLLWLCLFGLLMGSVLGVLFKKIQKGKIAISAVILTLIFAILFLRQLIASNSVSGIPSYFTIIGNVRMWFSCIAVGFMIGLTAIISVKTIIKDRTKCQNH